MADQPHITQRMSASSGLVVRLFAALMCGWLFMVPQVMSSTAVLALCDEQGCSLPPLTEEEEVGHSAVPPRAWPSDAHTSSDPDELALPHWEELMLHTLHGEVPHPPPWA